MDIYKLKFTILQQEIFRFLCLNVGKSFTGRSLSRHLNVSPTAISKSLPSLEKESLIVAEKDAESGRMSIKLNETSPRAIALKRIENLRIVYESGLADALSSKFPKATIKLVGKFSSGTDNSDSPIEISINSQQKNIQLSNIKKTLGRRISLKFSKKDKTTEQGINLSGDRE